MRQPRAIAIAGSILALLVVGSMLERQHALADPPSPRLGGDLTVDDHSRNAFSHPAPNLSLEQRSSFEVGDSLFNQNWVIAPASTTARDGLGPLFNARACSACHSRDGRAQPLDGERLGDGLLFRLSAPGADGLGPDPIYGGQFNHRAIPGATPEGRVEISWSERHGSYADGTPYTLLAPHYAFRDLGYGPFAEGLLVSPRIAGAMIGLGLLASVPEAQILARADPEDADGDGISGRPNRVRDQASGELALGRFGWKANQPNLRQQIAGAFVGDIGITSSLFSAENHTPAQAAAGLDALPSGGSPELSERSLDHVEFYNLHLAVPSQRDADDPQVRRGWELFQQARCDACHTPRMQTDAEALSQALANQTFHPFTDLLLHDMGPELADGRPDGEASGSEWRTPPLWGIGLTETVNGHSRFLHDGRARDLAEAILWHGGEGEASREAFRGMPEVDREALLAFLRSL